MPRVSTTPGATLHQPRILRGDPVRSNSHGVCTMVLQAPRWIRCRSSSLPADWDVNPADFSGNEERAAFAVTAHKILTNLEGMSKRPSIWPEQEWLPFPGCGYGAFH